MADIAIRNVVKRYGAVEVLHDISLGIGHREFVVLLGPSGCGKSTLLRMIAGLEEISGGDVEIDGERINDVPAGLRGGAMVFQNYALYPHMSAYENMAFGLRNVGMARGEIDRRVRDASRILQIDELLGRRPHSMSGGQRQRVAIGRAIVREPKVFLFDEPLSNLDASLRLQMRVELARLHQSLDATMIFVTHDQTEAMTMADRIVVLNEGRVEQIGTPLEIYHHPRNLFVAGFVGSPRMNLFEGRVRSAPGGGLRLELAGTGVSLGGARRGVAEGGALTLGLRPEALRIGAAGPGEPSLAGRVEIVEQLGNLSLVYVTLADGGRVVAEHVGAARARVDEAVTLTFAMGDAHLFDASGAALDLAAPAPGDGVRPARRMAL